MAHLIDKDALVAGIERILLIHTKRYDELAKYEVWVTAKEIEHRIQGLKEALSLINALEVKRVDLDEEIESYFKGFGKFPSVGIDDCIDIAKHFFELGLKVA